MKCVMTEICPDGRFIDLCHEVDPQNILSGAYLSTTALPHVPDGGVLMSVVDPGVGSKRRAIAVEWNDIFLVGPDNGIFDLVFKHDEPEQIVSLENESFFRSEVSSTFHGRDVFAPVSAHLAAGADIDELGSELALDDLERLPPSDPFLEEDRIECHIIHVDRFGNLITNLGREEMLDWLDDREPTIRLDETRIPMERTFSAARNGQPIAYFGSTNQLEIAVNNGDAARYFGANQGTTILVETE
jgi:S-adenosylmethionine hydrolase